jgi:NO-binding membrane sensor protein with MHYT domain
MQLISIQKTLKMNHQAVGILIPCVTCYFALTLPAHKFGKGPAQMWLSASPAILGSGLWSRHPLHQHLQNDC